MKAFYLSLWALAGSASAYLATTTRYYDGQEGACGCGSSSSGLDSWQLDVSTGVYTAAGSQALFDTDGSSWCGGGCGKCYNLTSTGTSACNGCGEGGVAGESIIVMVTNLCPYNGNEVWCPSVGAKNNYGYSYHFDIMAESEVFGDNVVVNFEPVACPGQAASDWETCICHGQTDSDTTPAGMTTAAGSAGTVATSSASSSSTSSTSSTSTTLLAVSTSPVKEVVSSTTSSTSTVKPISIVVAESSPAAVVEPTSTTVSTTSTAVSTTPLGGAATTTTTTTSVTQYTTVTEVSTIWATPSATTGSSGAIQTLYGQCGGINWTGATTCASGATCKVQNPYYSQCVSSS